MSTDKPRSARNILFLVVTALAVLVNLPGAYINYVVYSDGSVAPDLHSALLPSGLAPLIAGSTLTAVAYLLSLSPHRSKRPYVALSILVTSYGLLIAGYLLGAANTATDNFPAFIGALIGSLLLALPLIGIERLIGQITTKSAEKCYTSGNLAVANKLERIALIFSPGSAAGRRILGLTFAALVDFGRARPLLEEAYGAGDRSPELLASLISMEQDAGNRMRLLQLTQELYAIQPNPELFHQLIDLLLKSGRKDEALAELNKLTREERHSYLDTIRDLEFELGTPESIRALAKEYEHDGTPFSRARAVLRRLLSTHPKDEQAARTLLEYAKRVHDWDEAAQVQEKLLEFSDEKAPLHRDLVEYYRYRNGHEPMMTHIEALVEIGAANPAEKLEFLEEKFKLAEYGRVERVIAANPELAQNAEALAIHAGTCFELGRLDEALAHALKGKSLNPEEAVMGRLMTLETRIKQRQLELELAELEKRVKAAPEDFELRVQYYDRLVASNAADKVVMDVDGLLRRKPELRDRLVAELEGAVKRHGRQSRLLGYLSDIYAREKDWDKVFHTYEEMAKGSLTPQVILREGAERILEENPHHMESLLAMVRALNRPGTEAQAMEFLEKYFKHGGKPTSELRDAEFGMAQTLKDHERALKVGKELLESHKDDKAFCLKLAEIEMQLGLFDEAVARVRQLKEKFPDDSHLVILKKDYEERKKRARMEAIRKALLENPRDFRLQEELGDLHFDFAELNEAMVHYQKASQNDEEHNVPRAKLALVLVRKEMYSDAEDLFSEVELKIDQAAAVQNRLKALFYSAAELMDADNQFDRASHLLKRIFRVDAGYRDVVQRIETLDRMVKKKKP
ncbi:MAG: tetratricopeptide repeat protein [Candidatus Sumerlaeaceae bacterium]|nr:tetratricopeptide repeat protein [Candidatus Sumerlaeaceae bacterium]